MITRCSPARRGIVCPALPRLHATVRVPRSTANQRPASLKARLNRSLPAVGQFRLVVPQFDQSPVPLQQIIVRPALEFRPVELGSFKHPQACGSGTSPGFQPNAANSRHRCSGRRNHGESGFLIIRERQERRRGAPFFTLETASAQTATSTPAPRRSSTVRRSGTGCCDRPALGCRFGRGSGCMPGSGARSGHPCCVRGGASGGPSSARHKRRVAERRGQIPQGAEVGVIPVPFSGQDRMQRVMKIIVPLRGQAGATAFPRPQQAWIIRVAFRDEHPDAAPASLPVARPRC